MMTQFFQLLKQYGANVLRATGFYDDSILPGTKTLCRYIPHKGQFYDDSILPGTKTVLPQISVPEMFYDDSIIPGTKTM